MSRLERLLAGVAVVALLTAAVPSAYAASDSSDAIEAGVPIPAPADVSPPTITDFNGKAKATEPSVSGTAAAPATSETTNAAPATEPVKAAQAPVPSQDEIIAGKIKDLLAAKSDRLFSTKKDRAGAESFYAARNNAPVWVSGQALTTNAQNLAKYLSHADTEGLDPADYPVPHVTSGTDTDALAEAELRLTASALTFARHSQIGRVHFSRVSPDISYNLEAAEPADVLAKLADSKNAADALASYTPQHPEYQALKTKLAEIRGSETNGPAPIPAGATLKYNAKKPVTDSRVPLLRERLGVSGDTSDETYDKPLADAVTAFQKKNQIKATGQFNAATLAAMNGPKRERTADIIIANMERWRWMPHDLGHNRVILNIPDYTLHVYSGDKQVWQTRVVVGKPGQHATPLLTETMKYITVNPTWNVPPSIVYNEYLPALQQDPTVLSRMGLKLVQDSSGGVHISQPPGERNALGRIRFNFPNKFLVYQHDTPDKYLFAQAKRAYSHGCMRVQDPAHYAEVLLSLSNPGDHYTESRIKSMYGNSEIDIKLATPIPVHITYQTAFVDPNGKLQIRDDVYGRDARLLSILKGDERKVAEIPVEHAQQSYARPPVSLPSGVAGANSNSGPSYSGGQNFFEMLFGGGNHQPAPPPGRIRNRTATR
jgi:murein L,D-transpeptidase YcbB/YkuD